jgi:hypothetical protein
MRVDMSGPDMSRISVEVHMIDVEVAPVANAVHARPVAPWRVELLEQALAAQLLIAHDANECRQHAVHQIEITR